MTQNKLTCSQVAFKKYNVLDTKHQYLTPDYFYLVTEVVPQSNYPVSETVQDELAGCRARITVTGIKGRGISGSSRGYIK